MDYRTEAPSILRDFLVYRETVQGHSHQLRVLGHDHLSTTQIYSHVDIEELRTAAKANPLAKQRKKVKK